MLLKSDILCFKAVIGAESRKTELIGERASASLLRNLNSRNFSQEVDDLYIYVGESGLLVFGGPWCVCVCVMTHLHFMSLENPSDDFGVY